MIAFSGLDGAGKSTQIELLKDYFEGQGGKVKYFWSRGGYTPGMQAFKDLMRKSSSKKMPSQGPSKERNQSFSNPVVRKIWLALAILDLMFFYGVYIRLKSLAGTTVICDRYLFDTSIDFKLNFPQEKIENWYLWQLLCLVAVRPKKHFVLTITVAESQKRSKLKDEPFPDTEDTLNNRLRNYLDFVNKNKSTSHIDCSSVINDVHNMILKELIS